MCEVGSLSFVRWDDLYLKEVPFALFIDVPADARDRRTTNLVYERRELQIQNIRGDEATYDIDRHGFTYIKHATRFTNFDDQKAVETEFFRECREILKAELTQADEIFFFDWRLRSSNRTLESQQVDLAEPTDRMRPSIHAHIDLSPRSVLDRIRLHMPERADKLLRGRVRVVNLWRPLGHVQDWPIAVCDGSNVSSADVVETDHIRRNYVSITRNMMYNPEHRWYYLSDQRQGEVLLLKQFDSDASVPSKFCPHGSFKLGSAAPDAAPRESIEVRALVFTYPKET